MMLVRLAGRLRTGKAGWVGPGLVLLAISFQLQTTLDLWGNVLRTSVADLFAPFLLVGAIAHVARTTVSMPACRVRGLWVWLALLSGWMLVALFIGYLHTGSFQAWAVLNKFTGWFVLLGYFVLGCWVGGVLDIGFRDRFLRTFFVTGWAISAYSILVFALARLNVLDPFFIGLLAPEGALYRPEGFLANPNAFGYLVAVLLALQAPFVKNRLLFSPRVHCLGAAIAVVALVFSGSRSAWLGLMIAWPALFALQALDLRESLKALGLAGIVCVFLAYAPQLANVIYVPDGQETAQAGPASAQSLYILRDNIASDQGIQVRLKLTREALDAWRRAPVTGIGLGGFLWEQKQAQKPNPATIHNTFLWLLTETGVIGVGLFAAFFLACLRGLVQRGRRVERDHFSMGVFGALLVFAGASLGMEAMYQRHLWFLLGCALVIPARARAPLTDRDVAESRATSPRVLHVITDLQTGGAEDMLTNMVLAQRADSEPPVVVSLVPGGENKTRLEHAGISVSSLGMRPDRASFRALLRLAAMIRHYKPDVIQSWMYHADLIAAIAWLLSGRGRRSRLFWGIRCSDMDTRSYGWSLWLTIRVCALLSPLPDAVIANSEAGLNVHRRLRYRPRRFLVIDNGIDVRRFAPDPEARRKVREELRLAPDEPVLAFVARVDPMKDYPCFLAAFRRVRGARALLIGRDTESLPEQPGLVRLGQRHDVPRLLAACDILVSSSAFGEGFSNAIAEGMATGLAPIATDVGDARRIIGEAGLIVPPRDPDALADAIQRLVDNDAERREFGRRARRRIVEHFSLERAVDAFARVHREARSRSSP